MRVKEINLAASSFFLGRMREPRGTTGNLLKVRKGHVARKEYALEIAEARCMIRWQAMPTASNQEAWFCGCVCIGISRLEASVCVLNQLRKKQIKKG